MCQEATKLASVPQLESITATKLSHILQNLTKQIKIFFKKKAKKKEAASLTFFCRFRELFKLLAAFLLVCLGQLDIFAL